MKVGAKKREQVLENLKTGEEYDDSEDETPRRLSMQTQNPKKFQKLEDLSSDKVKIPLKKDGQMREIVNVTR